MFKRAALLLTLAALLLVLVPVSAQMGGERVTIQAEDGTELVGLYFAPTLLEEDTESGAPAVLLLHQSGGQKERWIDFFPVLQEAGYAALAVDLRGYGETGGRADWQASEGDIVLWMEWLLEQDQVDPARLHFVGASLGGDVGLLVMAADERVVSATVLSPGLEFSDVFTLEAVEAMGDRPVFVVGGTADQAAMDAINAYLGVESLDMMVRVYDTTGCCTGLFMLRRDLAPTIIAWLDIHSGR